MDIWNGRWDNAMNTKRIIRNTIIGLIALSIVFVYYESKKAGNRSHESFEMYLDWYLGGYFDGYDDGLDGLEYDPVEHFEKRFGYDNNTPYPAYSIYQTKYAAMYATGYGYGYQDGINRTEKYEDAYNLMNEEYVNLSFYKIYSYVRNKLDLHWLIRLFL